MTKHYWLALLDTIILSNSLSMYLSIYVSIYTVSQKKVPTFKLSVTLSTLNGFSKFLRCWKAYEICYKLTLGMLLHYLEKLKILIFCRYSADVEETANKLHFCRLSLCY